MKAIATRRSTPAQRKAQSTSTSNSPRPRPRAAASTRKLRDKAAELQRSSLKLQATARELHGKVGRVHSAADSAHHRAEDVHLAAVARKPLFPIVGIGASAGGLEAMLQLLRQLPKRTGMGFVLVQHLDPTHESALATLLSRATSMIVTEARNNVVLEPDHLYVIPPNKLMDIRERKLKLSPRRNGQQRHSPIDYFFRSLAAAEGSSSIGVVLSGNGSDGTIGLQEIKAAGGITFAQDEASSKYPAMPANAAQSQCVDFVMTPQRIARELTRIADHPYVAPRQQKHHERQLPTEEKAFDDILGTLRARAGVDFTFYKTPTLHRRIQRRMVLHKFDKQKDYAAYLRSHPGETKELFNDILIHVTGFFRDAALFNALRKKIFPRLVKKKSQGDPIRIWVPGCSTGEEVYSIAMTIMETLDGKKNPPPVQIFGTDINDQALERARMGLYAPASLQNISGERLRRFFTRQDNGYRITKALREMCIFARQNLIVDPPFSNLDLISCRNVLIYLGQPLQRKVMPVFHYALKPEGLLVLGASEAIGSFANLFQLVDSKAKVFTKRANSSRPSVSFGHFHVSPVPQEPSQPAPIEVPPNFSEVQKQADRLLLSHYTPAGVIINSQMEVLQFRGRTGLFLEHAHGEASLNLLKMAREGLAVDLRTAVMKAIKQNVRTREEGARVKSNGGYMQVAIDVSPFQVPPSREKFYLVAFETVPSPASSKAGRSAAGAKHRPAPHPDAAEAGRLREELAHTRDSLQNIIEEQEATNEELRSANEEIMSSNEELQSTNEELETAKEELQSTNEELTTLNEELETRNSEMDSINNDLLNVLAAINIPMLILSRDLRIRRFTTAVERLFKLIPGDIGRPLADIAAKIEIPNLPKLVAEVVDTLHTRELEVRDNDGNWWSARIRPYKTSDNRIEGAVVSLVDIDALKGPTGKPTLARAFFEGFVNTVREPLLILDDNLTVQHANDSFMQKFHVKPHDTIGHRIYTLGNQQWNIPKLRDALEEVLPRKKRLTEFVVEHNFPDIGRKKMVLNAQCISYSRKGPEMILLCIEDRTTENNSKSKS